MRRFFNKVEWTPDNCWAWFGCRNGDGYGSFWLNGKMRSAHRVSYEMFVGPIPAGMELDHLCRVRNCVNPLHLEPVLHVVNVARGELANMRRESLKSHCVKGHALSGDNVALWGSTRYCRECDRQRSRQYKERQRGLV